MSSFGSHHIPDRYRPNPGQGPTRPAREIHLSARRDLEAERYRSGRPPRLILALRDVFHRLGF